MTDQSIKNNDVIEGKVSIEDPDQHDQQPETVNMVEDANSEHTPSVTILDEMPDEDAQLQTSDIPPISEASVSVIDVEPLSNASVDETSETLTLAEPALNEQTLAMDTNLEDTAISTADTQQAVHISDNDEPIIEKRSQQVNEVSHEEPKESLISPPPSHQQDEPANNVTEQDSKAETVKAQPNTMVQTENVDDLAAAVYLEVLGIEMPETMHNVQSLPQDMDIVMAQNEQQLAQMNEQTTEPDLNDISTQHDLENQDQYNH